MPQTHYENLGVSRHASAEEIGAAFRKRAKQLHPDMPGGDAEKLKGLNEAYSVLKDAACMTFRLNCRHSQRR
jgi:molecular chaperone DnaJ